MRPGLAQGLVLLSLAFSSCGQMVAYAQDLSDSRTGRTPFVTVPSNFGGLTGFVLAFPVDLLALPVTYPLYKYQDAKHPDDSDPLSTLLFPSFFLWQSGKFLGAPFDLIEFGVYRAWRSPLALTAGEREEIELDFDLDYMPPYPVERVYPREGR